MGMDFLKSITGKVVTGLVALAVVAGGIYWWNMDQQTRHALLSNIGKIAAWVGIVAIIPWASFAIIKRVAKMENNAAGGILVMIYTLLEVATLAVMFKWKFEGNSDWVFLVLGCLGAGVYNLLACDWIAEKWS
jgi:hypothetical protein